MLSNRTSLCSLRSSIFPLTMTITNVKMTAQKRFVRLLHMLKRTIKIKSGYTDRRPSGSYLFQWMAVQNMPDTFLPSSAISSFLPFRFILMAPHRLCMILCSTGWLFSLFRFEYDGVAFMVLCVRNCESAITDFFLLFLSCLLRRDKFGGFQYF